MPPRYNSEPPPGYRRIPPLAIMMLHPPARLTASKIGRCIFSLAVLSCSVTVIAQDKTVPAAASPQTPNAVAAENNEPVYVRIKKNEGKPVAMQTAIARFVGKPDTEFDGKTVDLFGVVHIGQADYYREVDRRLATYDVVLYELVAPDGTRIRPEDLQRRRGLLSSIQGGMKDMLNLEYQLEKIDYMAKNFRHADMSPEEFSEDLERRGDSLMKMLARMMGASLAAQASGGGDIAMLMAMVSDDRPKMLKQAAAKQLVDMEAVTAGMQDANGEETLIKGRNAKAMKILRQELGGPKKTAAVFYGAGHLPDMADRLIEDFNMQPTTTTWLDAWDLTEN